MCVRSGPIAIDLDHFQGHLCKVNVVKNFIILHFDIVSIVPVERLYPGESGFLVFYIRIPIGDPRY